ncbi:UDP-galactopyranose mutase [Tsuneonella mangrovi]|uniref:UDP-galactopyranose mutase n=1 Tax=Tsuneonella mangrovi TaxID=1982042 RepID=UPI000BA1DEE5|nr:UDP-galactopyranose mutase [Tsuneonella mangrovi]
MPKHDWLIVGAGYVGATLAERIASQLGQKVLLIDRRNHIGGNAHDVRQEDGSLLHLYGPHIFHTNSKAIWDYLSQFTEWRPYFHHVLAHIDGHYVPLPFNINTIEALFPHGLAQRAIDALVDRVGFGKRVPILKLRETDDPVLRDLADFVYDKVFLNYTRKQWDLSPEQLNPEVTARVPILISRDNRYFQDVYQAMPVDGYTAMFERMLDHPLITVELEADYFALPESVRSTRTIFTGPIDEFFGHEHGALPYRSLRFDVRRGNQGVAQRAATINYPNEFDFTRITEQSYLAPPTRQSDASIQIYEYPQAYTPGENEPYYPIPTETNRKLLKKYQDLADRDDSGTLFAGRLADYSYYNMDQACGRALALFNKVIAGEKG